MPRPPARLAIPRLYAVCAALFAVVFLVGEGRGEGEKPGPRRYALLVGCSEYPVLRSRVTPDVYRDQVRLLGPENDVALMREVATTRLGVAPDDVTALAGWPDDDFARPTRKNLQRQLLRLSRAVRPGDFVLVYLAGHGTQLPDDSGDEDDGLDEAFLPADSAAWDPATKEAAGAMRDDELGERLRAIRDAKATVWLVVDSCHAGTMARGGLGGARVRSLSRGLLGVPGPTSASAPSASGAVPDDLRGIVTTYATRPHERALEIPVGEGPQVPKWHGILTLSLRASLASLRGDATLLEQLRARYVEHGARAMEPVVAGHVAALPFAATPPGEPPKPIRMPDRTLRLALVGGQKDMLLDRRLRDLLRDPELRGCVEVVDAADAEWLLVDQAFLRPARMGGGPDPSFATTPQTLRADLAKVMRVEGLLRLAAGGSVPKPDPALELAIEGPKGPVGEVVRPGDTLTFRLRNGTSRAWDVWLFAVDAGYGVTCLFPPPEGAPRLPVGARVSLSAVANDVDLGREHAVMFAFPRKDGDPVVNLRWLEASPLERAGARAPSGTLEQEGTMRWVSWETTWEPLPVGGSWPAPPEKGGDGSWHLLQPPYALLTGDEGAPRQVLLDVDGGAQGKSLRDVVSTFDAEIKLEFAEGMRKASYDTNDDGTFDLVLVDSDEDPEADRRGSTTDEATRWGELNVPWFRVAYLDFLGRDARYLKFLEGWR